MSTYCPEVTLARAVIADAIDLVARGRVNSSATKEAERFLFDADGPWANSRRFWCALGLVSESALTARLPKAIREASHRKKAVISDALSAA